MNRKNVNKDNSSPAHTMQRPRLSRRDFLQRLSRTVTGTVAGSLLAACSTIKAAPLQQANPAARVVAQPVLPSPQPPVAATATPAGREPLLAQFLALSALLTGVENLSPTLGRVYLQSLQASSEFGPALAELIEQAGFVSTSPPATLGEMESAGIFSGAERSALAQKILAYWYTGIYENADGEQAVATFVDSLTWETIVFTKPPTMCGSPGFWAERPVLDGRT